MKTSVGRSVPIRALVSSWVHSVIVEDPKSMPARLSSAVRFIPENGSITKNWWFREWEGRVSGTPPITQEATDAFVRDFAATFAYHCDRTEPGSIVASNLECNHGYGSSMHQFDQGVMSNDSKFLLMQVIDPIARKLGITIDQALMQIGNAHTQAFNAAKQICKARQIRMAFYAPDRMWDVHTDIADVRAIGLPFLRSDAKGVNDWDWVQRVLISNFVTCAEQGKDLMIILYKHYKQNHIRKGERVSADDYMTCSKMILDTALKFQNVNAEVGLWTGTTIEAARASDEQLAVWERLIGPIVS